MSKSLPTASQEFLRAYIIEFQRETMFNKMYENSPTPTTSELFNGILDHCLDMHSYVWTYIEEQNDFLAVWISGRLFILFNITVTSSLILNAFTDLDLHLTGITMNSSSSSFQSPAGIHLNFWKKLYHIGIEPKIN